eukprot:m.545235 g.545235  ORF g.545235 m.545235 type:complete len:54 (-) comp22143_c0_seq5:230-391(-)
MGTRLCRTSARVFALMHLRQAHQEPFEVFTTCPVSAPQHVEHKTSAMVQPWAQ